MELADIQAGDAVLDVACGRGAVLVPAARQAGPSGRVLGVDFSPEMVRLARERVRAIDLTADVEVMDAEHLEVADASFSVVLCGFGIFFFPSPKQAVAEFRRALAPHGRVARSTWGPEDDRWAWEDDLFADVTVERRAVQSRFDRADDIRELLLPFFGEVDVRTEDHQVHIADADEWWAWKWSYSLRGVLEQLQPARLDRLRREAYERLAAMRSDGRIPLRLRAHLALARG